MVTWIEVVDLLPAVSSAVALIACAPTATFLMFQLHFIDELLLMLSVWPSTAQVVVLIATLSEALTLMLTFAPLTLEPLTGLVILTVGGMVSTGSGTLSTVTDTLFDVPLLPAAS